MSKKPFILSTIVIAAAVSVTGVVLSQERQEGAAAGMDPMRAMMPGEAHRRLTRYVGEYDVTSRFAMPGMEPMETTGSASITSALGDRFIVVETEGTMMGRPYNSVQWYGHNNFSNRYEAVWMYTLGTTMMRLEGESKDDGATINWTGSYHGATGEETMDIVMRLESNDRFVIEMRDEDEGSPVLTTTYTRKKE